MRTLEYAMQDRTIAFEKHGTKVVFRKEHLDDYRAKAKIKSKDELCKQPIKERMLPCLRTIPDAAFSKVMQETQAFFEVDYQAERKGFMARLSLSNATDATKSTEAPLSNEYLAW